MLRHAPMPVIGVDFDNGSEFISWGVIAWADEKGVPVARDCPYQHQDEVHARQRDGDRVREHALGYRYETRVELTPLNELWDLVTARKNHLLPCVKANGWTHTKAGRKKRVYDKPRTPYQRLIDARVLDDNTRTLLEKEHAGLNPAQITRRIDQLQRQLIERAGARIHDTHPAA